jgi:hypothetical protein
MTDQSVSKGIDVEALDPIGMADRLGGREEGVGLHGVSSRGLFKGSESLNASVQRL